MPGFLDFLPLRVETAQTIRDRLDTDVNAGRDPDDPSFIDTTPGGFYWDLTQPIVLEFERLWDFGATDVPAAMFPAFAWGEYLDEHGETINVPRKDAVKAVGEVTFTGDEDTIIGIGTEVGTDQPDPDAEPLTFVTTESGTIDNTGELTLAVEAAEPGSAWNVAAGAVIHTLSPIDVEAVTNAEEFSGGFDVETDEAYQTRLLLEFAAAQGAGSVADYRRWALAWPGVGYVTVVPLWNGAGTVRVVITDPDNRAVPDTVEDGLQDDLDPYTAETQVDDSGGFTLPQATITVDSTTDFAAAGRLMIGDQLVTYTGKTSTTFTGCTGGSGSVPDNAAVVQGGMGQGRAPVGALVTVDTPAEVVVNVEAEVELEDGFSLDGAGGTENVTADISLALTDYVDKLTPGADVLLNKTESRFFRVRGVYNTGTVELNSSAANVSIADLQVARIGTITLTEI